ncbi:MAG: hypothetical protein ACK506_16300 [Pirellula sp.]
MSERRIEPHEERQLIIAYCAPSRSSLGYAYNYGYVMYASGKFVEQELEDQGPDLDLWDLDIPPNDAKGILVWSGVCENGWSANHGADWEPRWEGKWRNPELMDLKLVIGNIDVRSDAPAATLDPQGSIEPCTATTGNPLEDE